MELNSMPIDILERIHLRVDSPISLVRASSACKLWRQIIAATIFLKRFRSLHEPPVVGSYYNSDLSSSLPRFEPAPLPTTIDSSYLSLDFLPVMNRFWTYTIIDSRGSLLLVEFVNNVKKFKRTHYVCEPMTRRFEKVPSLVSASSRQREFQAFLLDGAEPGEIGMSNFRVVCLFRGGGEADIHTSGGSTRKVSIGNQGKKKMLCMGFAASSMYWYTESGTVYALDQSTAKFSSFSLPGIEDFAQSSMFDVTTGSDGKARIVFLGAGHELKVFARREGSSRGDGDWVLEKSVPRLTVALFGSLLSDENLFLGRSVPFSVETMGTVRIIAPQQGERVFSYEFILDIEKMRFKRITKNIEMAYPIKLPWPPSLHACIDPTG